MGFLGNLALYQHCGVHSGCKDYSKPCVPRQRCLIVTEVLGTAMYSDPGPGDRWGSGGGGKGPQRYAREVNELDYITPRGGYYFEAWLSCFALC